MNESNEWLVKELAMIHKWEKDQSDLWIWEKLGRLPFKLLDKFTPAFIQNKIGEMLDETGNYIQTGGNYLSSISKVNEYYPNKPVETLDDVKQLPIVEMDETAECLSKTRKKIATAQGASTGFGGIFTLAIDIPFLLGLQLKTLQDIAICYGYDPTDQIERLYIVKIMQFVSSDYVGKQAILHTLSKFSQPDAEMERMVMSELQGWREVFFTYRDQFGWKKLFQIVPIAGLVFGAIINRSAINDISEAGRMLYRKRRILERIGTVGEKAH